MNIIELARVVHMHEGIVHGSCAEFYDLEFPQLTNAVAFVESLGWGQQACLRDATSAFNVPVVVQMPVAFIDGFDILSTLAGNQ
ncbi:hypothetical protein [Embleya hyalina]|uniref:Uncharacterized protein n=1 Tax=Embleya hyalina TaxID=516124 RepID=A0A401YZ37_9ACTN|nr:hypothetical protein [Embleya hyalina]GCD99889.1 hypothetical protein EHYA_07611 [Embleya hyalina]